MYVFIYVYDYLSYCFCLICIQNDLKKIFQNALFVESLTCWCMNDLYVPLGSYLLKCC